jgi:hypothetical protein
MQTSRLPVGGLREIAFVPGSQIVLHTDQTLPAHPNCMRLVARDASGNWIIDKTSFSVGGGVVGNAERMASPTFEDGVAWSHSYKSARQF